MTRYRTFRQDFFFHTLIYYKAEIIFCVSVCKSVCVHVHAQTKRPLVSKFCTDILEKVFEKTSKRFKKKIDLDFLKLFLTIFSWRQTILFTILSILVWYSMSTAPKFNIEILQRNFKKILKRFFQKLFYIICRDTSKS